MGAVVVLAETEVVEGKLVDDATVTEAVVEAAEEEVIVDGGTLEEAEAVPTEVETEEDKTEVVALAETKAGEVETVDDAMLVVAAEADGIVDDAIADAETEEIKIEDGATLEETVVGLAVVAPIIVEDVVLRIKLVDVVELLYENEAEEVVTLLEPIELVVGEGVKL
ncbi:hypothetical protein HDU98_003547 [Podochytrium sp. JEL0797]|nr:hypothetical protein HDU98_003547 [Podochytrium sp. JEL0797]